MFDWGDLNDVDWIHQFIAVINISRSQMLIIVIIHCIGDKWGI